MKAVLISINPIWCNLIASGQKTLEVRKNCPKIETPFKCYIYRTRAEKLTIGGKSFDVNGGGKVVGEFTCDYIIDFCAPAYYQKMDATTLSQACLTYDDIHRYAGTRNVYGWHISNLRIYDTPKPLSEFKRWNRTEENAPCAHVPSLYPPCKECKDCNLKRPPQSWCYVEV